MGRINLRDDEKKIPFLFVYEGMKYLMYSLLERGIEYMKE